MHHLFDVLSLITHYGNADDNAIFIRTGNLNAPYCAFSLRELDRNFGFITWGAVRWAGFDTPVEFVEHCAESEYSRAMYWRTVCVGCGRKILAHEGPGEFAPNHD